MRVQVSFDIDVEAGDVNTPENPLQVLLDRASKVTFSDVRGKELCSLVPEMPGVILLLEQPEEDEPLTLTTPPQLPVRYDVAMDVNGRLCPVRPAQFPKVEKQSTLCSCTQPSRAERMTGQSTCRKCGKTLF